MPKIPLSPEVLAELKRRGWKGTIEEWAAEQLGVKKEGLHCSFGVFLEEGSILLGAFKDDVYKGIIKDGAIRIDGEGISSVNRRKSFETMTNAASAITGNEEKNTTSGWEFWTHVRAPRSKNLTFLLSLRDDFDELVRLGKASRSPDALESLMGKIRKE